MITSNQTKTQSNSDRHTTHHRKKKHKCKKNKINAVIIKKIISENKNTLPSLRNQEWKTLKREIEKISKLLRHISNKISRN